ncbi:MAG TPA: hypothetical protein VFW08_04240 [bacterium]|nr:hypothetical protein [bacterium]
MATEAAKAGTFLSAIRAGDLIRVANMLEEDPDLLFVHDDYYGSPVRVATDLHPHIADHLARVELARLRAGAVAREELYSAIHDLGEAAHGTTGYPGCEKLRTEAEPTVAGFLHHPEPSIRYIAINVLSFHWDLQTYVDTLLQTSQNDPADEVRQIALSAAAWLARGTRHPAVAKELLSIIEDATRSAQERAYAYHDLVTVWQDGESAFKADQQDAIDWTFVERVAHELATTDPN